MSTMSRGPQDMCVSWLQNEFVFFSQSSFLGSCLLFLLSADSLSLCLFSPSCLVFDAILYLKTLSYFLLLYLFR